MTLASNVAPDSIDRLNQRIGLVHDYWLATLGEFPTGPECAVIVMVLAALDVVPT